MNQEFLLEIKENIDHLKRDGAFENARIYLFGMNTPGDRVIQYLNSLGYHVEGILDNNTMNQGKTMLGVPVGAPDILIGKDKDAIRVLICSRYYEEMKSQLLRMGCVHEKYVSRLLSYGQSRTLDSSKENFEAEKEKVLQGSRILSEIKRKYENAVFFAVPIRANGDAYLSSVLAKRFLEKYPQKKVVVICIGNFCAQIIQQDGIFAEVVEQEQMEKIIACVGFLGYEISGVRVFYPRAWHYSILFRLAGYKKINYLQLLAASVGCGELAKRGDKSRNTVWTAGLKSPFHKESIILSPYANSLPNFPISFWEQIAEGLQERGYNVYTNSGSELEPVIKNTEKLFLPIREMIEMMNQVKAFISIRNGLCDVLAECGCQKIILYPEKGMEQGTVLDCYSLNGMGLCDDAEEIVYTEGNEKMVLEKIFFVINRKNEVRL